MGFQLGLASLGSHFTSLELVAEAEPDFLCLDPVLVAGVADQVTSVDVVQLLVRFADRIGAQVVATGVRTREQERVLSRNGVELFCGDLYARPDTRLPAVKFPD